jgi:pseudaminic acid cytidylyltransferase
MPRVKIAIIPARGGSKRIPRKNIRSFAGKPIIAYSISAAQDSRLFDRVIVSTDDEEIATVAREFGAETPFTRPAALADDFTGTNTVAKHAIQWLLEQGCAIEYACCIYATAPFLRTRYLRMGLDKLIASDKSFAFSVTSFPFPIWRAVRILPDGTVDAVYPENSSKRSQDLEEAYHDAGQFYWGTARAFLDEVVTFSPASVPVVLPRYLVHDIDTLEDWKRAELMFEVLQQCDGRTSQ